MRRRYRWTPDGVVDDLPPEPKFKWMEPDMRHLDEMEQFFRDGRAALADVGVPADLLDSRRDRRIGHLTSAEVVGDEIRATLREPGKRPRRVRVR